MLPQTHGSEREYLEALTDISTISDDFLKNLKEIGISPLSAMNKGKLEELIGLITIAEMGNVKSMELPVRTFNDELTKLARKFRVLKDSFRGESLIKTLVEHYKENPARACGNIATTVDSSIDQIDSVIAAYSRVDQRRESAMRWIRTIMAHHATDKARGKAQRSNEILRRLNEVINSTRGISHNTKLKFLNTRTKIKKGAFTTPNAQPMITRDTTAGKTQTGTKSQLLKDLETREARRAVEKNTYKQQV